MGSTVTDEGAGGPLSRRLVLVAVILLAGVIACTDDSSTTTVTALVQPPRPDITFPPLDPNLVFGTDRYAGYLPDGTDYVVYLDTPEHEEVTAIEADLMYEDSSGGVWWVGPVRFRGQGAQDQPGMDEGQYLVPIGASWTAVVDVSPDFVDLLGDDVLAVLDSGISAAEFRGDARRPGFPGLDLRSPFRWATSHDPLGPMEVSYETFSIQPGCDDDAAACTWTGFLQVRPRHGYASEAAEIDSLLLRPESDPNYLDPGPYGTRHGADVFWTGTDMIVWGGQSAGGAWQSGGASFDPGTNVWKTFDGPVIAEGQPSRAAWTDTGMVVVTAGATFRGDPGTDVWEEIGEGIEPPAEQLQHLTFTGGEGDVPTRRRLVAVGVAAPASVEVGHGEHHVGIDEHAAAQAQPEQRHDLFEGRVPDDVAGCAGQAGLVE